MISYEKPIKIVGRWAVTAELEYTSSPYVVASGSTIKPLLLPNGEVDLLALEEYEDFVINLLGAFNRQNFEVIKEIERPYSHSYYLDLVKKDQFDKKQYKYILYVRVSDYGLSKEQISISRKGFADHIESQKMLKLKSEQRWKLKRLTVNTDINKDTYYSYDEALEDIEDKLEKM